MTTCNVMLGVIRASHPSFKNSHDRVDFTIHASILANGYPLIATGSSTASLTSPILGNEGL